MTQLDTFVGICLPTRYLWYVIEILWRVPWIFYRIVSVSIRAKRTFISSCQLESGFVGMYRRKSPVYGVWIQVKVANSCIGWKEALGAKSEGIIATIAISVRTRNWQKTTTNVYCDWRHRHPQSGFFFYFFLHIVWRSMSHDNAIRRNINLAIKELKFIYANVTFNPCSDLWTRVACA